jgi:hypothetical protein
MIILIKLLFAHLIGDFLLLPDSWVRDKNEKKVKSLKLYIHVLIHGILVVLILWDYYYWHLAIIIMILHGLTDIIKLYAQKEHNKSQWILFDQGLKMIFIIALWYLILKPEMNLFSILGETKIWIYLTSILFITVVSGILVKALLSSWSQTLNDGNEESLNQAGKYIGILERIFVFIFVITGKWEGIGFLLAAKSVFRFGDLKESKDRKLTEYILIGTLLSFGIAIATGMLVVKLVEKV